MRSANDKIGIDADVAEDDELKKQNARSEQEVLNREVERECKTNNT